MPNIKLQSSDDEPFEVDVEIAKAFVMIRDMGMDAVEQEVIRLPNVNSDILKSVIQWATYHKDDILDPVEVEDEHKQKKADEISSWDVEFLNVDTETLFELIHAANYLDIKDLFDISSKAVADMIKGKSPEEIRKTFNLKHNFTPCEEELVRREDDWCKEK